MADIREFHPIADEKTRSLLTIVTELNCPAIPRGDLKEQSKELSDFVEKELLPDANNYVFQFEKKMFLEDVLKYVFQKYGVDERKVGHRLTVNHVIDTARVLLYMTGRGADYLSVAAALLHDIIEDVEGMAPSILKKELENKMSMMLYDARDFDLNREINTVVDYVEILSQDDGCPISKYLEGIFTSGDSILSMIKLSDKIAQTYEMKERAKIRHLIKHMFIEPLLPFVYGRRVLKWARETECKPVRKVYDYFENPKLKGHFFLMSVYKDFRCIDYVTRRIKDGDNDPKLREFRDTLIERALKDVIGYRKEHLGDKHLYWKDKKRIDNEVKEYVASRGVFGLTHGNTENDALNKYYLPADEGNDKALEGLNAHKRIQYRHLSIFEKIFERYLQDTTNKVKDCDLFVFGGLLDVKK